VALSLTFVNQIGAADGMNQAAPGSFIPESFVRWAQDVLFDRVGYLRRRAPFNFFPLYNNATIPSLAYPSTKDERVVTIVSTLNPNGDRITGLVLATSSATRFLLYNENFRNTGSATLAAIPIDTITDCKQASNGGMWLSFLESYKPAASANEYYQYYWYGGAGTEQTVANVDLDYTGTTSNSTYLNTLQGTFDPATITPGMFVYVSYGSPAADYYIGMVKSVTASTVTFDKDIIRFAYNTNIHSTTAAHDNVTVKFRNVRPYIHVHSRGLITYDGNGGDITSGAIGTEGEGHFKSADLDGAIRGIDWALYRASDGEWLGDVDSVTNNTTINIDNNYHSKSAKSKMTADEYVAYPYQSVPSATISNADSDKFAGIFNATYAGYQWFGNAGNVKDQNRVVFSSYHVSEGVDLSFDAPDSIIIPGSTEMRGLAGSTTGLLVFTSDKTYIIRGNYRANFSLEELYPEGCLSSMSIVEYGGGVFWASRVGILFYDGASVRNLTEANLGVFYTDSVRTFDVNADRIYSFLHKDYLFVHFNAFESAFSPVRYEPVYAENIDNTPAIADFEADDWDPDFTTEDFLVENNVPIYWDYVSLYDSTAATSTRLVPVWADGKSYVGVGTTSGSANITSVALQSFTGAATTADEKITLSNHGLSNGTLIRFTSLGTITGPTVSTTNYYVINATTNDFQVSTSVGGSVQAFGGSDSNVTGVVLPGTDIIGPGIPSGTTISSVTSTTTITMSANATATATITVSIVTAPVTYLWGNPGTQYVWGPIRKTSGITFAIYLPTNAITTLSNFDFRGATKIDAISGIKALTGSNIVDPEFTVVRKSLTSNVATLTLDAAGVPNGSTITVSGIDSTFDGTYTVSAVSGTTVSYAKTAGNVTEVAATGRVSVDGVFPRAIDVDSILETTNDRNTSIDAGLIENNGKSEDTYIKGPDFYLQTKHYTVGDPVLRKWFRQVMLNLYLLDGGLRMDIVDMEDADRIDVTKKQRKNWELFDEATYSWDEWERIILPKVLSPNRSTWQNVEGINDTWYEISDAEFTRRKKKISWRYPSVGFRLYQMNKYRPANYQDPQRPHTIMLDAWNIGFKPMRASRV
jgi:hypothetical protein